MTEYTSRQYTCHNREQKLLDVRDWAVFLVCCVILCGVAVHSHRKNPDIVGADIRTEFSEARARSVLEHLETHTDTQSALTFVRSELLRIQKVLKSKQSHIEFDIQVNTDCSEVEDRFDAVCDSQNTNIVVRVSSPVVTPRGALTVACKIPFYSDGNNDTVSLAILLDILTVFAHKTRSLRQDLVFVFYAGNESLLDGVQAIISQFPSQRNDNAVLILENTGDSRREILFHANAWLHELYLKSASHRLPNALVLDFVQGVWDKKDLRYFRDNAFNQEKKESSLNVHEVGFVKHGWTNSMNIETGAIQRFVKLTKKLLGFRDWIIFLTCCTLVSAMAVQQHRKMPEIVNADVLDQFSEIRARSVMNKLKMFSFKEPKVAAHNTLELIHTEVNDLLSYVKTTKYNNMKIDVQTNSGCFDIGGTFSEACDQRNTSILVTLTSQNAKSNNALILASNIPFSNDKYQDKVLIAIQLDILRVFAFNSYSLPNNLIFFFAGDSEPLLGQIERLIQSMSSHEKNAVLILQNTGYSRREITFHANSWLHEVYLKSALHRLPDALALELIQSKWLPIKRSYFMDEGIRKVGVSLDIHRIALLKHGWTEDADFTHINIETGAIQRGGEDILSVLRATLQSRTLSNSSDIQSRTVFNDLFGIVTIEYSEPITFSFLLILLVWKGYVVFSERSFSKELLWFCLKRQHFSLSVTGITMTAMIPLFTLLKLSHFWYTQPFLMLILHVAPITLIGISVHCKKKYENEVQFGEETDIMKKELSHFNSIQCVTGCIAILYWGIFPPLSLFLTNYVIFQFSREIMTWFLLYTNIVKQITPRIVLICQFVSLVHPILSSTFCIMFCLDHLDLVLGRFGLNVQPELVMGTVAFAISSANVLFFHNLVYITQLEVTEYISSLYINKIPIFIFRAIFYFVN